MKKIPRTENHTYFEVIGAGQIEISHSSEVHCGGETGFSFGVEWGEYGFAGGVLSKEEAIKLAEHILRVIGEGNKILRQQKLEKINHAFE